MTKWRLSVIMPVYNEKDTILEIVGRVKKVNLGGVEKEIIVVDDFSTDGTREMLKNMGGIRLILHQRNMGKGFAIRSALREMTGNVMVIQDGDLEVNPEEFPKMLKLITNCGESVVYGSRTINRKYESHDLSAFAHNKGNIILSFIASLLYRARITDMETCYKMMKRGVIDSFKLRAKRFDFEPEITAKILKAGYNIHEVPISYSARSFKEGKKINWLDGMKALWYLVKYRFVD